MTTATTAGKHAKRTRLGRARVVAIRLRERRKAPQDDRCLASDLLQIRWDARPRRRRIQLCLHQLAVMADLLVKVSLGTMESREAARGSEENDSCSFFCFRRTRTDCIMFGVNETGYRWFCFGIQQIEILTIAVDARRKFRI